MATSAAANEEPLTNASLDRLILFPIKHEDIWEFYTKQKQAFWTPEEIDLAQDVVDWQKLSDGERTFLKHVLAFFASSDSIIMENLSNRFSRDVQVPEVRQAYAFQNMMEALHTETYELMIDAVVKDAGEKLELFQAIKTMPSVAAKANWALKWIESNECFATRLLAFSVVEGVFFSSSFCSIFWIKTRGLMPGLAFLNALISRDEGMHTEFAVLLYTKYVKNKLSEEKVHAIVREAVEAEEVFVKGALGVQLIGMNETLMAEYVRYVADAHLVALGYSKLYGAAMPPLFDFMNNISVPAKSNFFEARVAEYKLAAVSAGERKFAQDMDF